MRVRNILYYERLKTHEREFHKNILKIRLFCWGNWSLVTRVLTKNNHTCDKQGSKYQRCWESYKSEMLASKHKSARAKHKRARNKRRSSLLQFFFISLEIFNLPLKILDKGRQIFGLYLPLTGQKYPSHNSRICVLREHLVFTRKSV